MSFRKISQEEEYIARKEFERKQKLEEEKRKLLAAEEKKKMRQLHHMCCPKCGMQLIEIDYKSIKVDECSSCKGIWLDAGELDAVVKLGKPALTKFFSIFSD